MQEQTFKSFAAAAKAYFGMKPDEKLGEFLEEVKALSPDDKEEMTKGMKENGILITG